MANDPIPDLIDAATLHISLALALHEWGRTWLVDARAVWRGLDGVLYAQQVRPGADRSRLADNDQWEVVRASKVDEHMPAKLWLLFRAGHGITLG